MEKERVRRRRGNFTLIEMLVVVAIIAILAAMLSPSLMKSLAQVRGVACANNLRQVTLAQTLYAGDYDDWIVFKSNHWPGAVLESHFKSHDYFIQPYGGDNVNLWLCPGNAAMTEWFNHYNIYGMYNGRGGGRSGAGFRDASYDAAVNGDFIRSPDPYNVLYRLTRARRPGEQALYADTVYHGDGVFDGGPGYGKQWYAWCPSTLEERAGVHALHLGGANFSYFDGGVRKVMEARLDAGLVKVTKYVNMGGFEF